MTWSYSRISCFEKCPYKFYLKYIYGLEENDMFYASYGKYIHSLLERFYKGKIKKEDLKKEFIINYSTEVKGERPPGDISYKYFQMGLNYFSSFTPIQKEVLAVEKKYSFDLYQYSFVGILDLVVKDSNKIYIVDNKSRNLKPRSKRKKPTNNDLELDVMLKQLYLYSIPIIEKYGYPPDKICFNCFKSNTFIEEPFDNYKFEDAKEWSKSIISTIEETETFVPRIDFFGCNYLCGLNNQCEYYDMVFNRK